jgi:hypothetical protein
VGVRGEGPMAARQAGKFPSWAGLLATARSREKQPGSAPTIRSKVLGERGAGEACGRAGRQGGAIDRPNETRSGGQKAAGLQRVHGGSQTNGPAH